MLDPPGSSEGLNDTDFTTTLTYTCSYDNASAVPANLTFIGRSNATGAAADGPQGLRR